MKMKMKVYRTVRYRYTLIETGGETRGQIYVQAKKVKKVTDEIDHLSNLHTRR